MANDSADSIQSKLLAIRERFAAQLGERLDELRQRIEDYRDSPSPETLRPIQQRLHSLAGACGMFGFARLGHDARHAEIETKRVLDLEGGGLDAEFVRRLLAWVSTPPQPDEDSEPAAGAAGGAEGAASPAPDRSPTVLIEEEVGVSAGLADTLAQFGYAVVTAHGHDPIDADVRLLCMAAGRDDVAPRADVPTIVICDDGSFAQRLRAVRAGGVAFFTLPVDVTRLAECIDGLLVGTKEPPARVLVVDDEPLLTQHFTAVLRAAGMAVEILNAVDGVLDMLAQFRPEVILLDLNMPGVSGQELARVIRQQPEWVEISITYLSAESSLDRQIQALGEDADDFLQKPIPDRQLVAAVAARARRARQLARMAAKDGLTGLLKHAAIREHLVRELIRQSRAGARPVSVAMIDIDRFKTVNDTWGHVAGDRVIKALAQLLRQRLRNTDGIGRYGGEEFLVVMPDCGPDSAMALIDDVRRRFSAIEYALADDRFKCTFSAGVATTAEGGADPALLVDEADKALYRAKRGGRNRVVGCMAG